MTQSITIESPDQIRSSTFEYDYPDRVQAYHYRSSRFDKMLYPQICYSFLRSSRSNVPFIEKGCGFGLTTIEADHDLSHDLTR